jgi:ATP-dependent DNA ligase
MAKARQADAELDGGFWRGPLHGVPIAVKDLCYTDFAPTAAGMRIHRDFVPTYTCTVVERLERAGAIIQVKCLNRAEFVVIGWTEPEGRRPYLGALQLGYYDPGGRLIYAGRVGSGIDNAELERLWRRLQPIATDRMPLDVAPPRGSRFGSPLVLSRVHWVRPELVVEVKFLAWTEDNLLRQVVYEGLRQDKPARDVRREMPRTKSAGTT